MDSFYSDAATLALYREVLGPMKAATGPTITSLSRVVNPTSGEHIGTGNFLDVSGSVLVVSAAHLLREVRKGEGLAYSTGHQAVGPAGLLLNDLRVCEGVYDLLLAGVDEQFEKHPGKHAIPAGFLGETSQNVEDDLLFVHGFPGRKSYSSSLLGANYAESLPYGAQTTKSECAWFDPKHHFAVQYPQEGQRNENGEPFEAIDPHGLSGSFVWNTNRLRAGDKWSPTDARIVGVVTDWDQAAQCLVVTRVECLLAFLRVQSDRGLPETRSFVRGKRS